jgi:hypothetical protein
MLVKSSAFAITYPYLTNGHGFRNQLILGKGDAMEEIANATYLVKQGVASVADIDTAIAHGPGLCR